MKIQEQILEAIYNSGKPLDINQVKTRVNNLRYYQIYNGVYSLVRRGLIKKEKLTRKAGYCQPPTIKIVVKINEKQRDRIEKIIKNSGGYYA